MSTSDDQWCSNLSLGRCLQVSIKDMIRLAYRADMTWARVQQTKGAITNRGEWRSTLEDDLASAHDAEM